MQFKDKDVERFHASYSRGAPDDCWPWTETRWTGKTVLPYGRVWWGAFRSIGYAHRASWILANGPIPDNAPYILHTCNNPPCVNPAHLYAGTQAENVADRQRDGVWHEAMRNRTFLSAAKKNASLTDGQASYIKERFDAGLRYGQIRGIARRFNVCPDTISRCGHGRTYRWVSG